ncbi:lysozyme [Ferrimonas pelagia]|uniref:Lysozyme n=1 Tax=Ferrimonas pelagia TaxID=1177826 RepID=A0ABP9ESH1_9GAMM
MNRSGKAAGGCVVGAILAIVVSLAPGLQISGEGLQMLADLEGCERAAYQCSADTWTVGIGHTIGITEGGILSDDNIAQYLVTDVRSAERAVNRYIKVPLTQGQFDAFTSFVFNVGQGNFRHSTLVRRLNAGEGLEACDELKRWVFVSGKDCRFPESNCAGIVKRRQLEYQRCRS